MQATFSFYRLGLLIRKQWADRGRLYLLIMGAITGLLALSFFLWGVNSGKTLYIEPLYIVLFVGLFLGGFIVAGMAFSDLSQRTTGIYYLGVPATHLEKLVCSILYAQVFFAGVYLCVFFLLKAITYGIVAMHPQYEIRHVVDDNGGLENFQRGYYFAIRIFAAVQTFYLLGSVYFERFAFVKTTVAGVLTIVAFVLFVQYVIIPISPDNVSYRAHEGILGAFEMQGAHGETYVYTFPSGVSNFFWWMVQYMWMPLFWIVTYFRLKEKEI
jgi:hypothetical protein